MSAAAIWMRERRKARREAGLCLDCGEASPEAARCGPCRERMRAYRAERVNRLKAQGRCRYCTEPVSPERQAQAISACEECLTYYRRLANQRRKLLANGSDKS